MIDPVLRALGAGGDRGLKIATVICLLVTKGAELGELEPYEKPRWLDPGRDPELPPRIGHTLRRRWLDRLAYAIESDVIDGRSADWIVDILLRGDG
jgi:hypothetical protein